MKRLVTCSAVLSLSVFTAASQASIAPEPSVTVTVKPTSARSIPAPVRPTGPTTASATTPQSAPRAINLPPALLAGIVRELGLDPDTDKGRLLAQWLVNALNDPDLRRYVFAMAQHSRSGTRQDVPPNAAPANSGPANAPLANAWLRQLNADDRLALIRSIRQVLSGMTPEQCGVVLGVPKGDIAAATSVLSSKQFEQLLAILTTIIKANAVNPPSRESYSTQAILKADGDLAAATNASWANLRKHNPELPLLPGPRVDGSTVCLIADAIYDALLAMKEPERSIATWDVLSSPWKGMLASRLASNPDQYVDSDFDIQSLPPEMARHLPKAGSHPMAYDRVVVVSEWVNAKNPTSKFTLEESFRNMHDTGVTVSVNRLAGMSQESNATFNMVFGDVDLKTHSVNVDEPYVAPGLMPAEYDAKLDTDAFEPRPGTPIYMPGALPSRDNDLGVNCTVSAKYPASKIDSAFTGDAVDLKCSAVGDHYEYEESYLYDYRIALHNIEIDDDGLGYVTKRTVSITH